MEPFICEIGSGHGHFLTGYAAAHPEKVCVGIDIVRERVMRATRKRDRAKLPGLHFILADASDFLAALPEAASFAAIFVLFPDPWPKRRHHKNRLLQSVFLDRLAARSAPGTRFYFRTDHEAYFTAVAETIRTHACWRPVEETWPFERQTVFQARARTYQSLIAVRTTAP